MPYGSYSAFLLDQTKAAPAPYRGTRYVTPTPRAVDPAIPLFALVGAPEIQTAYIQDSGRDWTTPYQNVTVKFSEAVADASLSVGNPATGFTVYVNGSSFTPTYRSGSGTDTWGLRIATGPQNGQTIEISYSAAAGSTVAVSDSKALLTITKAGCINFLSKRIRFTLKNKINVLVTNEAVQVSLHEYAGGDETALTWMSRSDGGQVTSVTSDANGVVDLEYRGVAAVGGQAYVVLYRVSAVESMAWTSTIQ